MVLSVVTDHPSLSSDESRLLLRDNPWTVEENICLELGGTLPNQMCAQTEHSELSGQCFRPVRDVNCEERNEQADLRAGNVWKGTAGRRCSKSVQRIELVNRQRQGATVRARLLWVLPETLSWSNTGLIPGPLSQPLQACLHWHLLSLLGQHSFVTLPGIKPFSYLKWPWLL